MGVTVPAGVATISAPPVRNQSAVIAAPPLMSVGNPLIFQQQSAVCYLRLLCVFYKYFNYFQLLQKAQTDAAKKVEMTTVFVGNITDRASDMLIRQLLTVCFFISLFVSNPLSNLEMWFCSQLETNSRT